ncbi:hypothetical protein [Actinoplanes nipponensis]|nr:hypothetical protein [Actinoplanes nipponensis]
MDDNEHPPENDHRPHLNLERHLTIGPHVYQLTAAGTGDEPIGLSLVGWSATGEVVSEISGGISPADLAPVADALTSTLAGLAALRRQRLTASGSAASAPTAPGERQRRHRNQGVRWTAEDDERLAARHRAGASSRELMAEFGRSRGGILARLEHLGLITPDAVPVAPAQRSGAGDGTGVVTEAA